MSREAHVRICEGLGVRLPRATRPLTPNADSQFTSVASLRSVSYLLRNNWSSLERNITALTWVLENGLPARFGLIRQAISYCGLCSAQREVSGL